MLDTEKATAKIHAIEALRSLLGTMVFKPEYRTNPDTFSKELIKNNQVAILEFDSDERKIALNTLVKLVESINR